MNINNVSPDGSEYLQIVGTIAKPPKSLYLCGSLPEGRAPTVAIVGTRRPTPYGREVGHRLAYELAAQGVMIVSEASAKSGTMHTANFALEQGRTVMAVPGNITNPMSQGCNNLIKAGALPVTEVEDVLLALGLSPQTAQTQLAFAATPEEEAI